MPRRRSRIACSPVRVASPMRAAPATTRRSRCRACARLLAGIPVLRDPVVEVRPVSGVAMEPASSASGGARMAQERRAHRREVPAGREQPLARRTLHSQRPRIERLDDGDHLLHRVDVSFLPALLGDLHAEPPRGRCPVDEQPLDQFCNCLGSGRQIDDCRRRAVAEVRHHAGRAIKLQRRFVDAAGNTGHSPPPCNSASRFARCASHAAACPALIQSGRSRCPTVEMWFSSISSVYSHASPRKIDMIALTSPV